MIAHFVHILMDENIYVRKIQHRLVSTSLKEVENLTLPLLSSKSYAISSLSGDQYIMKSMKVIYSQSPKLHILHEILINILSTSSIIGN